MDYFGLDWMVSVDDHIIEPGHVWQRWLPERYRDRGPQLVRGAIGHEWDYDGKRLPITGLAAVAGTPKEQWNPLPMDFEKVSAAYYDIDARVAAMNQDGVIAALLFPTMPRFCGQTFLEAPDKELALACVEAYNNWMLDEWCASAPGRFIPLVIVPLWDAELAAAEVRRTAAKGAKSVTFSENPSKLGLPSIHDKDRYWDPLWQACDEAGLTLSIHIGSSSESVKPSPDSPLIESLSLNVMNGVVTFIEWMYSGNLIRFPNLKLAISEGGIGWMPWAIERIRRDLDRQLWARESQFEGNLITGDMRENHRSKFGGVPHFDPLEIYERQVFGCMLPDDWGWDLLPYLGTDNVMIETDYPHSDSTWPSSIELANKFTGHLSDDERFKILWGNACRVFDFTPADPRSISVAPQPSGTEV
jgi:predicted TIM-barrel fold metal-dependent hydrolase